jgi:hypothetical protein
VSNANNAMLERSNGSGAMGLALNFAFWSVMRLVAGIGLEEFTMKYSY